METQSKVPTVIIIGAGFGGLAAARSLADAPVRVILVDRTNHHLFQPLLYQVATAGLSTTDIAKPIRSILSDQKNVETYLDEVLEIDVENRIVRSASFSESYDYLLVAAGARQSYFGRDEWEEHAPGLKTLSDAMRIRKKVLSAFEFAENPVAEEERKAAMTFVVVGGGPTGVEMAGAIAELAHFTIASDFRHIDPKRTRIILAEAGERLLSTFAPDLSQNAKESLESLGVEVHLGKPIKEVTAKSVTLGEETIATHTVVWAAGNAASPLARQLGAPLDRQGKVKVSKDLTIPGHPEIQVIGDMVALEDEEGKPVPGVAPAAMQMGTHAGRNILRQLRGEEPAPFSYFDKGSMATIGRHSAVFDFHGFRLTGTIAWLAWAFVHLYFLIGFKNRIFVFLQLAWAYFTFKKGARIIPSALGEKLPS